MRRPDRVLHFAWDPAVGGAVEPPTGEATTGWATGQRPPAQYINALFNNQGSWIDFLRGPSLSRWTRAALPGTLTAPPRFAADRTTVEGDTVLRRLVIAGYDGAANCVYVSHRGAAWTRQVNFPWGIAGDFSRVLNLSGTWYLCLDDTADGYLLTSPADGEVGSALDGSPNWSAVAIPASGAVDSGVRSVAQSSALYLVVAERKRLLWFDLSVWGVTGPLAGNYPESDGAGTRGFYNDVLWDGTQFVAVSTRGDVVRSTNGIGSFWAADVTLTAEADLEWRLTLGEDGEVVAWVERFASARSLWRSTDHGVSWVEYPITDARLLNLTDLAYFDGQWVASTVYAPHLWSSNDLIAWTALTPPVIDDGNGAIYGVTMCEGGWVALRTNAVLNGDRAEDLAPGAWSVDPTPTTLGNAGWLAGYRINLTAPTDGQVLAWDAGTSRYVPTTPSAGAAYTVSTKTTTYTAVAGDVLLCDASGGAFTVTLPAAATVSGSSISVKKSDASANAVTIDGAGAETIDGAATLALSTQYEAVTLWSDGTSWWVF